MAFHRDDSQHALILNHMKHYGEIDPDFAYKRYGVYRLGAIIFNIRKEGYKVESRIKTFTKPSGRRGKCAVYSLAANK